MGMLHRGSFRHEVATVMLPEALQQPGWQHAVAVFLTCTLDVSMKRMLSVAPGAGGPAHR
jgi:hypothetical protein